MARYSSLNAVMGSMRTVRRVGRMLARKATASTRAIAAAIVAGSFGATP
jgi:hypothetical protein